MPEDVEKVKICRLSGMRAGPHCEGEMAGPSAVPGQPIVMVGDAPPEPPEPNVYEDLFPIGAIPSEICTLHDRVGLSGG
jgi:hypothetical protein